jgi:hypothetical protein
MCLAWPAEKQKGGTKDLLGKCKKKGAALLFHNRDGKVYRFTPAGTDKLVSAVFGSKKKSDFQVRVTKVRTAKFYSRPFALESREEFNT